MESYTLNTSNPGKQAEFTRLFQKHGVQLNISTIDLPEIDAPPLTVITHKASQLKDGVLVEDSVLDVEKANIGINVKWLLEHLKDYIGHKATWRVFLAFKQNDIVYVYLGEVKGQIVAPKGDKGFGFDPVFLPDGESLTLAESKPDTCNARALAVEAFLLKNLYATRPSIPLWKGQWQK